MKSHNHPSFSEVYLVSKTVCYMDENLIRLQIFKRDILHVFKFLLDHLVTIALCCHHLQQADARVTNKSRLNNVAVDVHGAK